ncbi:MAG: pyridoxine 5'-phosphate synthase [Planctomycetota bacterium]
MKLGVNIDHVATVRQARRTFEPAPVRAAVLAELGGADSIVIHLREDRRHIQDQDLKIIKEVVTTKLNLEMGLSEEIIRIALTIKPHQVTIVPERREELTTEGGLDLIKERKKAEYAIKLFRDNNINVSVFIDPEREQLQIAKSIGTQIVELHTGLYANATDTETKRIALDKLNEAAVTARNMHLAVAAGHGLNYINVSPIIKIMEIEELNIGHSIIGRAIMVGIERAVREMKEIMLRR